MSPATPDDVVIPARLWQGDDMRAALTARDIGSVIRLWRAAAHIRDRNGEPRKPSQGDVANLVGTTQGKVSRYENGQARVTDLDMFERFADGLRIPGRLLGLAPRPWETRQADDEADAPAALPELRPFDDEDDPADPWSRYARTDTQFLDPEQFLGYTARVLPDHYLTANLYGPRQVIDVIARQARSVHGLQAVMGGSIRKQLLMTGSRLAEFCGWLWQELGNMPAARYWSDRSLQWAQEAADDAMTAYALYRKANEATQRRHAREAVSLARAAQRAGDLPPKLLALAAQQEGQAHAVAGDPRLAQFRFDEAVELAAVEDPRNPPWADYCTPTYVEIQRAHAWTELGQPTRAVEVFTHEITQLPPTFRTDHGVYLSRLARAHAVDHDPEESARVALEALAITRDTSSGRALAELTHVGTALEAWSNVPAVREFQTQLTAVRRHHPGPRPGLPTGML